MYKHRKAGGHAMYGRAAAAPVTRETEADVEMQPGNNGVEKLAVTNQQPAATRRNPPPPATVHQRASSSTTDYPPQHVPI
jgi:hypothetical protein